MAVCSVWQCAACGSVQRGSVQCAACGSVQRVAVWQCAACGSVQRVAVCSVQRGILPVERGTRDIKYKHTLSMVSARPASCTPTTHHGSASVRRGSVHGSTILRHQQSVHYVRATQTLTSHHGLSQCMAWKRPWIYYFKTPTICTLCAPLKHLQPIMGSASVWRGSVHGTTISRHQQSVHYVRHSNTYNPSWAQPVYGVETSMELLFQDTNNLHIMCATQTLTTHHGLSQCTAWQHPRASNKKHGTTISKY